MARVRMVTRTVKALECTVMMVSDAQEVRIATVTIGNAGLSDKKLEEAIKATSETENAGFHYAFTQTRKEVEVLYGMLEQDFINLAKVLDPETRKALEVEEA